MFWPMHPYDEIWYFYSWKFHVKKLVWVIRSFFGSLKRPIVNSTENSVREPWKTCSFTTGNIAKKSSLAKSCIKKPGLLKPVFLREISSSKYTVFQRRGATVNVNFLAGRPFAGKNLQNKFFYQEIRCQKYKIWPNSFFYHEKLDTTGGCNALSIIIYNIVFNFIYL